MAVEVTRREIHRREVAVRRQRDIDQADALEELGPVDGRHLAHAGDDVAHGDVHRALFLVFLAHDLVGGRPLRRQAVVEPAQHRRHRGVLIAQALHQLDRKGAGHDRLRELAQGRVEQRGGGDAVGENAIGEGIGGLAGGATAHDPLGGAAQVLDQHDAQRDRHRPELADGQRLDALVGVHEARQGLGIEAAVGMGDEGPRQPEDARIVGERAGRQLRELPIVPGRQIVANLADLFLGDVEVVDQPVGSRRDDMLLADRRGDRAIGGQQHPVIVAQAPVQRPATGAARLHPLGNRQTLGVLLEALDAEQFGANRIIGIDRKRRRLPTPGRPWRAGRRAQQRAQRTATRCRRARTRFHRRGRSPPLAERD